MLCKAVMRNVLVDCPQTKSLYKKSRKKRACLSPSQGIQGIKTAASLATILGWSSVVFCVRARRLPGRNVFVWEPASLIRMVSQREL